jgi:hypothetical protein
MQMYVTRLEQMYTDEGDNNILGLENNRISNIKIYEDDFYKYT